MKKMFVLLFLLVSHSNAGQLVEIQVQNDKQADLLNALMPHHIIHVGNQYLLYFNSDKSAELVSLELNFRIINRDIELSDIRLFSPPSTNSFLPDKSVYNIGNLYVIHNSQTAAASNKDSNYRPADLRNQAVRFTSQSKFNLEQQFSNLDLQDIIDRIIQDSLDSYLHRLEAFTHRLTGTDSSYAARDWIENKFRSFGYDSVMIDPFIGSQLWDRVPVQSYNVIAYKIGTKHPDKQIIIGAHFDAVPDCPGADDNGSGTAAVLELSRIFKDIETDMTYIFIAFDSEESWMWGSYHYADSAFARGDDIILMVNPDMIGHINNSNEANLYYGQEDGYAHLWDRLSDSLVNISGVLSGSTASDHLPFQEYGYDVIFVQERNFSTHYHQPSDSTTYINFEYMTRMTKGIAATVYTVSQLPPPVEIVSLLQPGDGQSMLINWELIVSTDIIRYEVCYYPTDNQTNIDTIIVLPTDSSALITGLTGNIEYSFFINAVNSDGQTSIVHDIISGTPNEYPATPAYIYAYPKLGAIELTWATNNYELDFSHYALYKDSQFVADIDTNYYYDNAFDLGNALHSYHVIAVDLDGNSSSVSEAPVVVSRAAVLEANRILAVNRSNDIANNLVDESETGNFLREALTGYDFDYYSDSCYYKIPVDEKLNLFSMLDYGIVVIGAESGLKDDIAQTTANGGITDYLNYYLSLGGKLITFGRWGNLAENEYTIPYNYPTNSYFEYFVSYLGILSRTGNATILSTPNILSAELIGAKSQKAEYPNLDYDSSLVQQHCFPLASPDGIPLTTYIDFIDSYHEILYTFDSRTDNPQFEDKPVAWKRTTDESTLINFEIPLSFFDRTTAITALQTAVDELLDEPTDISIKDDLLPDKISLGQNYPNPFNPVTSIEFSLPTKKHVTLEIYNILGQKVKTLANSVFSAGAHILRWNGTNQSAQKVSSGIYLYQLKVEKRQFSRKMVLLQ